jgi:hypothetical protein
MMKTYSHIRREALNQAAAALEPTATTAPAPPKERRAKTFASPRKTVAVAKTRVRAKKVMSQSMSQFADRGGRVLDFAQKIGSSGWIRTSNPPVNSNRGAWHPRWTQKLAERSTEWDRSDDQVRQATAELAYWRAPARLTAWLRSQRSLTWWPIVVDSRRGL